MASQMLTMNNDLKKKKLLDEKACIEHQMPQLERQLEEEISEGDQKIEFVVHSNSSSDTSEDSDDKPTIIQETPSTSYTKDINNNPSKERKSLKRKADEPIKQPSNSKTAKISVEDPVKVLSDQFKELLKRIENLERKIKEMPSNNLPNIQSSLRGKSKLSSKSAFQALKEVWMPMLINKLDIMHVDINKK